MFHSLGVRKLRGINEKTFRIKEFNKVSDEKELMGGAKKKKKRKGVDNVLIQ